MLVFNLYPINEYKRLKNNCDDEMYLADLLEKQL